MNKSRVKKIVIFMLLVISMVACFSVIPNIMKQHSNSTQEEVLDLGLDYEDGWYLINNAEDYYIMQHNLGNGIGADAKYRLTADISVSAKRLNELRATETQARVFSGSLDGGNYTINADFDISEEEQINAKVERVTLPNSTVNVYAYGALGSDILNNATVTNFNKVMTSDINFVGNGAYGTDRYSFGVFYGYAYCSTFINYRLDFDGYSVTADAGDNAAALGGLVGTAYNCSFQNCIVKNADMTLTGMEATHISGDVSIVPNCYTGAFVGWAYQGTNFVGCLAISVQQLSATDCDFGQCGIIYGSGKGGDFGSNVGNLSQCHYRMSYDDNTFFTIEGGGVVDELDNVATTLKEYNNSSTVWVLIEGINGGEIIQKVFVSNLNVIQLQVYNPMTWKGRPDENMQISAYILEGMTWEEIIDEVDQGTGALKSTDYFKFVNLVNNDGDSPYNSTSDIWDGNTDKFDKLSTNVYRLNAVWHGVVELWVYNVWSHGNGGPVPELCNRVFLYPGITWNEIIETIDGITGALTPPEGEALAFKGLQNSEGECPYNSLGDTWDGTYDKFDYMHENAYRLDAVWATGILYLQVFNVLSNGVPLLEARNMMQFDTTQTISVEWSEIISEISGITGCLDSNENYEFKHLSGSFNGDSIYSSVDDVWEGDTDGFEYENDSTYNLYAVWENISGEYTVTLLPDGGTIVGGYWSSLNNIEGITCDRSTNVITYTSEVSSFALPSESQINKTNYTFNGWEVVSGDVSITNDAPNYMVNISIAGNAEIKALWIENEEPDDDGLLISLNRNGGTITSTWLKNNSSGYTRTDYADMTYVTNYDGGVFVLPKGDTEITRDGYKFLGWTYSSGDNSNLGMENGYVVMIISTQSGMSFRAEWEEILNYNTASLVLNGGELKAGSAADKSYWSASSSYSGTAMFYHSDKYGGTLPEPTRGGYSFLGWELTAGPNGMSKDESEEYLIFNFDNDKYVTRINPEAPSGFEFTAQWELASYTITLNMGDGASIVDYNPQSNSTAGISKLKYNEDEQTISYGIFDGFNLPTPLQVRHPNKVFLGWELSTYAPNVTFLNSKGEVVDRIQEDGYYAAVQEGSFGDVTIKAIWQEDGYTITLRLTNNETISNYNPSGATFTSPNKIMYTSSNSFYLPNEDQISTTENNMLMGWEIFSQAGELVVEKNAQGYICRISLGSWGDAVLTPVWKQFGIASFALDGGEWNGYDPSSESIIWYGAGYLKFELGTSFNLPTSEEVSRNGYILVGWELDYLALCDGMTTSGWIEGGTYSPGYNCDTNFVDEFSFVAVWELAEYSIKLMFDGTLAKASLDDSYSPGGGVNVYDITDYLAMIGPYTISSVFRLPDATQMTRTYYDFQYWEVTRAYGNWNNGDKYFGTEDITGKYGSVILTGVWIEKEYTIILDANGGTISSYSPSNATYQNNIITYTYYDKFYLPTSSNLTKNGYTFRNWKIAEVYTSTNWGSVGNEISANNSYLNKYGNIKLIAIWTVNTYTLAFDANGGTLAGYNINGTNGNGYPYISYTIESSFNLPTSLNITKSGSSFGYWKLTIADGNWGSRNSTFDGGKSISNKYGNVILQAVWDVIAYKITLDPNSGIINSSYSPTEGIYNSSDKTITYTIENEFDLPSSEMSRSGYEFIGWKISNGGKELKYSTNTNGNIISIKKGSVGDATLQALWSAIEYILTFNPNDGVVSTSYKPADDIIYSNNSFKYTIESKFNLPMSSEITLDGRTFDYWQLIVTDGNWGNLNSKYSGGQSITQKYGNITLKAIWKVDSYQITLNVDGGNISGYIVDGYENNVITYTINDVFELPNVNQVLKAGYTFTCWVLTTTAGNWGSVGQEFSNVSGKWGNVELTAQWEAKMYTLTFDSNEGTLSSSYMPAPGISCEDNQVKYTIESVFKLPTASEIVKDGSTFSYWKLTITDGNWEVKDTRFNSGEIISQRYGNIELQAIWDAVDYTIIFNLDNAGEIGTGELVNYKVTGKGRVSITYTSIDLITLPSIEQTVKTGYTLKTWKLTTTSGNWDAEGTMYNPARSLSNKWGNVTLTAVWELNSYKITLEENGGSLSSSYLPNGVSINQKDWTITYNIESIFNLPTKTQIVRDGYVLSAWVPEDSSNSNWTAGEYAPGKTVNVSYGNVTLVAKWTIEAYIITLEINNGSINNYNPNPAIYDSSSNTISYNLDHNFYLPSATEIMFTGHTFGGWEIILTDGNWETEGTKLESGENIKNKYGNVTLKAMWTAIIYTLTMEVDSGTISTSYEPGGDVKYTNNSIAYTINSVFALPKSNEITKSGSTFGYWKLIVTDGNWGSVNSKYSEGQSITQKYGNIVLQAVWDEVVYTITLDANNGIIDGYSPSDVTYSNNVINYSKSSMFNLPNASNVVRLGYMFDCWRLTEVDTNSNWGDINDKIYSDVKISGKIGNIRLEAVWTIVTYIITFDLNEGALSSSYKPNEDLTCTNNKINYTIEDIFNLPTALQIIKNGSAFGYWKLTVTDGNWGSVNSKYSEGQSITQKYGNITLQAVWDEVVYTITLDVNNGIIDGYSPSDVTYSNNVINYSKSSMFNLPNASNVIRLGYTFDCWRLTEVDTNSNWGTIGETFDSGASITDKYGDVTLTAVWQVITYVISLQPNNGTISSSYDATNASYTTNQITYTIESEFRLPNSNEVTRNGYVFDFWRLASVDGNWGSINTEFISGASISNKYGNVTLQAEWKLDQYTITFVLDNNGEVGSGKITNDYNPEGVEYSNNVLRYTAESVFNLPTALQTVKDGYIFKNWLLSSTSGNWGQENSSFNAGETISHKWGNVKLTAVWDIIEYVITFNTNNGNIVEDYDASNASYNNNKILYNIENVFNLPETDEIRLEGYKFRCWKLILSSGNWGSVNSEFYAGATISEKWGNVQLEAQWAITSYTITLSLDNDDRIGSATIRGYTVPNDVIYSNNSIGYNTESSIFNLPATSQVLRTGYIFSYWKLIIAEGNWGNVGDIYESGESISQKWGNVTLQAIWELVSYTLELDTYGGKLKNYNTNLTYLNTSGDTVSYSYNIESEFNLPNNTEAYKAGYTITHWELRVTDGNWGTVGTQYLEGSAIVEKYGDVNLRAIWAENKYTIIMNSNNQTGETKTISPVKYTEIVSLTWEVEYVEHVFVGWAMLGYETTQTYRYIDKNFTTADIEADFGTKILQDGGNVSKLTHGDLDAIETVNIYAIWLPIYTVTIESNGAGIYENGILTNMLSFTGENHYYKEYILYSQLEQEVLQTPTILEGMGEYRLYLCGYYITGWVIKADGVQYYVPSETINPGYSQWEYTDNITMLVESGTNLQYLQGEIVAIPQWKAFQFDVRFVTNGSEAYKDNYDNEYVSEVVYNSNYVIDTSSNLTNTNGPSVIRAEDVLGYTVIYAHPYKDGEIDSSITITLQDIWNYDLSYKRYTKNDAYSKDSGWYVIVEGYYSPDLYRLKLDLQLPYDAGINFKINSNGFTLNEVDFADLQALYSSVILNAQGKYIESENYINRQNKLYHTSSNEYYIYLLQDQKVDGMQIYDIYNNGKNYNDSTGVALPSFEIPYYEMQYYYTFNDLFDVNLYEMAILDREHKKQAQESLIKLGAKNIIQTKDWKYNYCDSSEILNNRFALNVYWYRNIVNITIRNLLENKASFNGYALITEYENVTGQLQGHTKYNLVIYAQDNSVYDYITYSFDDIALLQPSVKYQYKDLAQLFETGTTESLLALGISKKDGNTLPIYFGNSFTVQAVDQSKDHSLDEFVGYRFDNYDYNVSSEQCSTIAELDGFVNDGTNYTVKINLQNYGNEYNGNTTNYFVDKDEIDIDVNFDKITYIFNYQVTNINNIVNGKYGSIEFIYKKDAIQRYQFEYFAKVDNDNALSSMMNVRLGSELIEWRLVNDIITSSKLTESQLCEIFLNADFLREKLYLNIENLPTSQYPSTAEQFIGYMNAACKDIDFKIKVNVKDLKEDKVIREYILNGNETNSLFTITNQNQITINTVAIDNEYVIKMLSKQDGDNFLYYYQDGEQYVIRKLYIRYSLAHSTNMLVNDFGYPIESIDDIEMNVNNALLEGTINYTQFIEVSPENRYLNFYVEISPIVNIQFEVKSNEYDKFKEARQLSVGNVVVASALDSEELRVTANYIGYWGQETLFNLVANENYYSNAKLIEYYINEELAATELSVAVNSNIKHIISENAKIVIELIPKLYNFNAVIQYNENEFSANDFANVVNASGTNIFDINKGVVIKAHKNNIDPINGVYYYGDKLIINYTLSEELKNDFIVSLYCNDSKLYYNYEQSAYIAQFTGKDIQLRIVVLPKTDEVVLTTNLPNHKVGNIYAQINDGEITLVQDENSNKPYKSFTLINGDKLNVYINENVGFEFTGEYEYDNKKYTISQTSGTDVYEKYIKITLFDKGFSLSKSGWYYLMFEQIPIDIQFKYYVISPTIVEDINAGNQYTAHCDNNIIQENSLVTLTKGNDNVGYRFEGYSYNAPIGDANSNQFDLATINTTQQSFVIEGELLDYLSTINIVNNKLPLIIYVNYVRQYYFDIMYLCAEDDVVVDVNDKNGNILVEGLYYDYGTELSIDIQSLDTKHYQLEVVLYSENKTETINTATVNDVELVEESIITTNLGGLSGFVATRQLVSNYVIKINTIVEKYNTVLNQNLYKQLGVSEDIPSVDLQGKDNDYFEWHGIYYQVNATHEYSTEVEIKIFVLKPMDKTKQYYTIDEVYLNDKKVAVSYDGEGELDSMKGYYYSFKYKLIGDDLPTELKLDVNFKALYYIELK